MAQDDTGMTEQRQVFRYTIKGSVIAYNIDRASEAINDAKRGFEYSNEGSKANITMKVDSVLVERV